MRLPMLIFIVIMTFGFSLNAFGDSMPELVAQPYPGAVPACFEGGKAAPCSFGGTHHDPYGFLTRDSADKVKAFYAQQGMRFDVFPVKKDLKETAGDGLSLLQHATYLLFQRDEMGMVYAAPVEFYPTKGADDEPDYFNTVIVATGRPQQKLASINKDVTALMLSNPILRQVALRPETAAILSQGFDPKVSVDKLLPIFNDHLLLFSSFFQLKDRAHAAGFIYKEILKNRVKEMSTVEDMTPFQKEPSKLKDIKAYFEGVEKEAYPTLILIQKKGGPRVKRDAATLDKQWKFAFINYKRNQ